MLRLILSGCNGRMGRAVEHLCAAQPDLEIAAGFDLLGTGDRDFPVFSSPAEFQGQADAVIDFSSPAALPALLDFCTARRVPVVLATTGYSQEQLAAIDRAAERIPVFRSANMSVGVNVLLALVRQATAALGGDYDIEIVEKHHNKKVDAPSGTALMLADAAASALPCQPDYVYDRHSVRRARAKEEIGICSVRGGGIVGDHDVLFAGENEVITLSHSAMSREVFASGAIRAARFLSGVASPGLYSMTDLVQATLL
ncbi:4-hydroxy-tetrahydrodipicolinate reductase [uncultured Flavonifractor sp.]|uniref:4-hydroxy-tetrahydrodipicolinate reductase n=1 Tax=Candidatus Flavonifractor intestinigallinarum TaxID=2838586 RepID=A0A9D2MMP2_9FIRM|nr:4-hydroxy-tetrahydrodipicolinate reductase [uncultured Flavonifractor sp.]HJB79928.1 4-hydroxy-tetrahydrodipicolinate reductase [Candidatus Flavonifractor intestinigallinarum]